MIERTLAEWSVDTDRDGVRRRLGTEPRQPGHLHRAADRAAAIEPRRPDRRRVCPIAGQTGTLSDIFVDHPIAGRLLGKTGTLSNPPFNEDPPGVKALAGYVGVDGGSVRRVRPRPQRTDDLRPERVPTGVERARRCAGRPIPTDRRPPNSVCGERSSSVDVAAPVRYPADAAARAVPRRADPGRRPHGVAAVVGHEGRRVRGLAEVDDAATTTTSPTGDDRRARRHRCSPTSLLTYRRAPSDGRVRSPTRTHSPSRSSRCTATSTSDRASSVSVNGRHVTGINETTPVIPASNQKLLVAAVALEVLGADYRFTHPCHRAAAGRRRDRR